MSAFSNYSFLEALIINCLSYTLNHSSEWPHFKKWPLMTLCTKWHFSSFQITKLFDVFFHTSVTMFYPRSQSGTQIFFLGVFTTIKQYQAWTNMFIFLLNDFMRIFKRSKNIAIKFYFAKVCKKSATSMMVTDVGDKICWQQL